MDAQILRRIGNTPLFEASRYAAAAGIRARLLVKAEMYNPFGSVKDRVALRLVRDAVDTGKLVAGGVVAEPTSGNTGIGLAAVCAALGYRAHMFLPAAVSRERRILIEAYGARAELVEGDMARCRTLCAAYARRTAGGYMPDQFRNPASAAVHFETTAPEIWRDAGRVDAFVAGVGSGGTITGVGRFLRARNPHVHIVAVEPSDSPVLSGGRAGPHELQGIGAGFVPEILDTQGYDEVCPVTTREAYTAARTLARTEGIAAGISSGAALAAVMRSRACALLPPDAVIVVLLPDGADRYLSADLYGFSPHA